MYKKLVRHGNSNALVLDKPILELLNISEETLLKITTDGISLTITPISASEDKELTLAYDHVLKPLDALNDYCTETASQLKGKHIVRKSRKSTEANGTFIAARKEIMSL